MATIVLMIAGVIGVGVLWWLVSRYIPRGIARNGARIVVLIATAVAGYLFVFPREQVAPQVSAQGNAQALNEYTVVTGDLAITLSSSGSIEPLQRVDLSFQQTAPVDEVLVENGDAVEAGAVLATLDAADQESNLRRAEIALREAQNTLAELTAPPREIDIRIAQADIETALLSLEDAQRSGASSADIAIAQLEVEQALNSLYQRQLNRDMVEDVGLEFQGNDAQASQIERQAGLDNANLGVTIAEVDLQRTLTDGPSVSSIANAEESLLRAQIALDDLIDGPDETTLVRAEIDVRDAELEVERLTTRLEEMTLVAPFSGVVAQENLTPGEYPTNSNNTTTDSIGNGSAPIILIDDSGYRVTLEIDETEITDVAVGQRVEIEVDAIQDEVITGVVTHIDETPDLSETVVTYAVEVILDPTEARLRTGMSITADIVIAEVQGTIVVPNGYIRTDEDSGQTTVTIINEEGNLQARPVTVGLRNNTESQITAGLQPGQTIVLLQSGGGNNFDATSFALQVAGSGGGPGGGGGGGNRGGGN